MTREEVLNMLITEIRYNSIGTCVICGCNYTGFINLCNMTKYCFVCGQSLIEFQEKLKKEEKEK